MSQDVNRTAWVDAFKDILDLLFEHFLFAVYSILFASIAGWMLCGVVGMLIDEYLNNGSSYIKSLSCSGFWLGIVSSLTFNAYRWFSAYIERKTFNIEDFKKD